LIRDGVAAAPAGESSPSAGPAGIAADIRVAYERFELRAQLQLPGRGVSALFGPSGSGKTTCLRSIAGLEPRAEGRVALGSDVWQDSASRSFVPTHRRPLGIVFQDAQLFAHLRVRANIEYGMRRVPASERRIGFDEVVALLGIAHLLDRRTAGLSGGERQRVAIARALLTSPRLLLLDEPLAALDDARKAEVLPYLERLRDELSIPMVYVSHAMSEVARLADHLVLMRDGRVLASGPVADVTSRLDLPLAGTDDAAAIVTARIEAHDPAYSLSRASLGSHSLWIPQVGRAIGQAVRLQIAARDVSIALTPPRDSSIVNVLPCTVTARADDDRGRTLLRLDVGGVKLLARVTRRSAVALDLREGTEAHAQIKGVALLA
jgi:molybdate transport system ATP-binding protein